MTNDDYTHVVENGYAKITIKRRHYCAGYEREYTAAPRLYVYSKDETLIENLENRRRRPYTIYKKLLPLILPFGLVHLGSPMRWSQNAGCSCGCSPGFILPRQDVQINNVSLCYFDVWVELKGAPTVDERKPARDLVLV